MKFCSVCHEDRDLSEFRKDRSVCRKCESEQQKELRRFRTENNLCVDCSNFIKSRKSAHRCHECAIKDRIRNRRIVKEDRELTFNAALNTSSCDICGIKENANGKDWSIDHSHKTKKFRGILCNNCNLLLGHAKDSSDILNKAIEYLYRHEVRINASNNIRVDLPAV